MQALHRPNLTDIDLSSHAGFGDSMSLPTTPDRTRSKPFLKPKPKNIPTSVLRGTITNSITDSRIESARAVSMLPTVPLSTDSASSQLSEDSTYNPSETQMDSPNRVSQYPAFRSRPLVAHRSFDMIGGARDSSSSSTQLSEAEPPDVLTRSISNQETVPTDVIPSPKPRPSANSPSPLLLMDRRSRVQDLVSKFDAISLNTSRAGVPVIPGKGSPRRCVSAMTHREDHPVQPSPPPQNKNVRPPKAKDEEIKIKRNKFFNRKFSPKTKIDTREDSPSLNRRTSILDSPIVERSESLYESKSLDRASMKKSRDKKRKESFLNFITGSPKNSTSDLTEPAPTSPPSGEILNGETNTPEAKKKTKKVKGKNIMKNMLRTHKNTAKQNSNEDLSKEQNKHKKKRKQVEIVPNNSADFENTVEIQIVKQDTSKSSKSETKNDKKSRKSSVDKSQSFQPICSESFYTDLDDIEANRRSWIDPYDSPLSQKRPGSKRDSAYDSEQSRGDSAIQEPHRLTFKPSLADEILEQVGIHRDSLVVVNDMYESISLSDRPTPISLTDEDQNSFNSDDDSHKTPVEFDYTNDPLINAPAAPLAPLLTSDDMYDDIIVREIPCDSKFSETEACVSVEPCSNTLTPVTPLNGSVSPSLIYENFNDSVEEGIPSRSYSDSAANSSFLYDLPYEPSDKRHTLTSQPRPSLFKISPLETSLELDLYESVEVSRDMIPRSNNAKPMLSAPSSVSHKCDVTIDKEHPQTSSNPPKRPSTIFTTDTTSLYRSTGIASVEALILEASIACKKKSFGENTTPAVSNKEVAPRIENVPSQEKPIPEAEPTPRASEGDSFSDSSDNEMESITDWSLRDRSSCSSPVSIEEIISSVRVIYSYSAQFPDDISLKEGDIINVLDTTDPMWWIGRHSITLRRGYFPSSYVEPYTQELLDVSFDEDTIYLDICPEETISPQSNKSHLKRRSAIKRSKSNVSDSSSKPAVSKLSQDEMRYRVIEELVSTERNFLKSLKIVIKCRDECVKRVGTLRPDSLFTTIEIQQVFNNIEELYHFEEIFLRELNECVKEYKYESSMVGNLFVRHEQGFKDVYIPYCNNQTVSSCRLSMLMEDTRHLQFFRSFTVLTTEDKLPIEAYLLKPVQKICKYHLQLKELLKSTSPSHPDHPHVEQALEVMKGVTANINEKKRRIDNLPTILSLQHSIDNWIGPDILDNSTTLLQSGKLYKISKGHSQERKFYLFDNLLLYCKEDALRTLKMKGRITLNEENIVKDLDDDQLHHNGIPLKNAWKIINRVKDKEYIIYTKDARTKRDWLDGFKREREMVGKDKLDNFKIAPRDLEDALFVIDCNKKRKKKGNTARTKSIGFEFIQKSRSLGKEKSKPEILSSADVVHSMAT
ncbi:Rho guanine nucleotide exchange factor 4-like [Oopsacas minuta]|uniref:Rho guanine nucleotide exchange factor 4-like n=1 Tax=Oopsacas minuta TaxID=111878 RepID=A0AAV7K7S8_9METZ|nr:Rho guanine nucleotide exchange factor 4-like [Oopsacas minuta]